MHVFTQVHWLLEFHHSIVVRHLGRLRTGLELFRIPPCFNLMILLCFPVCSEVELKRGILALVSLIVDIVSCGEDEVLGDEGSAAYASLLVPVEEDEGSDGAMKSFLKLHWSDAKEVLVADDLLVRVLGSVLLLISKFVLKLAVLCLFIDQTRTHERR